MANASIPEEIGDINLDNYYLDHQTYNKSVYVHKKFLPKNKFHERKYFDPEINNNYIKVDTHEKSQQFDTGHEVDKESNEKRKVRCNLHDQEVVTQTVKFAKDLAPKIIPPSREYSPTPVVYTIKTSKKHGRKISKCSSPRENDTIPNIHKSKDRCTKKEMITKEDVSQSTQDNTSDDIQTNQSSSISLSEVFENKLNKTKNRKRKQEYETKDISNTMEGIATTLHDNKIKIQIMNEEERNILYDSIRDPIVNSVKEYLNEIKNPTEIAAEMKIISQTLASNMEKLDYAIHTLQNIERKILDSNDKKTKVIMSPKPISSKASRLEELAEDMPDLREVNGEEYENGYKTMVTRSAVVAMSPNEYRTNRVVDNYDHGETGPVQVNVTYSQLESKQERPNRIPARFCWTDGNRKK